MFDDECVAVVEGEVVGAGVEGTGVDVAGVEGTGVDVAEIEGAGAFTGGGTGDCPIGEGAIGAGATGEGVADRKAEFV